MSKKLGVAFLNVLSICWKFKNFDNKGLYFAFHCDEMCTKLDLLLMEEFAPKAFFFRTIQVHTH